MEGRKIGRWKIRRGCKARWRKQQFLEQGYARLANIRTVNRRQSGNSCFSPRERGHPRAHEFAKVLLE